MPGPKPENPIVLTVEEEQAFRRLVASRKTPQGQALRARILLTAHEHPDWNNHQIARTLGCSHRTVRKWRRRWVERKSIEDLPRPGAPRRFSP